MEFEQKLAEDTAFAQWIYQQYATFRNAHLGAHLHVDSYLKKGFEYVIGAYIKLLEEEGFDINNVPEVITAKSPWHAYLIIEHLNQTALANNTRLIFRGQYDSTWDIEPSINRAKDRTFEEKRATLFMDVMAANSFNALGSDFTGIPKGEKSFPDVRVSQDTYLAGAQHYGIATNLVDWTTDPAIAVFFATQKSEKPSNTSSVYIMMIDEVIEKGFKIIIPPPFIERLHLQRGFFIEVNDGSESLKKLCIHEIQFPSDYLFEPFQVIRRDLGHAIRLLPDSDKMADAIKIIDEMAIEADINKRFTKEYRLNLIPAASRLKHHFMDIYHNPYNFWYDYCYKFEQILFWTCYKEANGSLELDKEILSIIVKSNRDLSRSVVRLWRYFLKSNDVIWDELKRQRIDFLIANISEFINIEESFDSKTFYEGWKDGEYK